jgi:predicted metal-binding membrane protein
MSGKQSSAMKNATPLAALLKRDHTIVLSGLIAISLLAWAYMVYLAWDMEHMKMAMPQMQIWGAVDLVLLFVMWAVMMVAMMVPSAAPLILIFVGVNRKRQELEDPVVPTTVFLGGYLLIWIGFSAIATLAQWVLHTAALLSPMMESTSSVMGGVLLLAAGIFQWTPFKNVCLKHCRSPLGFIMTNWREGTWGALIMGLKHGSYCVGCCWILMALLFVAGVMNLLWVAIIAAFVLAEKVLPRGDVVGHFAGVVLFLAGIILLSHAW